MLILTRRAGEKLIIGETVKVTVLSIKGNQIRFGIDAPRDVSVHREEIHQRILEEQGKSDGQSPCKTSDAESRVSVKFGTRKLSLSAKSQGG